MLQSKVAESRLSTWQIAERDEFDPDETVTRFATRIQALPARLASIAYGLYGLNEQGEHDATDEDSDDRTDPAERRRNAALADLDRLSARDRTQLLKVPFPQLAADVNRAWEFLQSAPYSTRYDRQAFRAPAHPEVSLAWRGEWLGTLLKLAEKYQEDIVTAPWLATWAPYLEVGFYDDCQREAGCLFAPLLDAGGPVAEEVFDILCQSARNEHEIGGMGRHVIQALLLASRPEGWDLIERLLLAARRQEGLRQSILETVDLTHPEAFRRMLRLIVDEDLVRFSAVARAVNVWFGLSEQATSKVVSESIQHVVGFLEAPATRKAALGGTDPAAAYFALWTTAFEDAYAALPLAAKLLKSSQPEMRFVACKLIRDLDLKECRRELNRGLEDEDLRVVRVALMGFEDDADADEENLAGAASFEILEKLIQRLPEKPRKLPPLVWNWTAGELGRKSVVPLLLPALGPLSPTRLVPYLAEFGVWDRREIVELFEKRKQWDNASRNAILGLIGDSSADVREMAIPAAEKFPLTEADLERLETMLSRKAGDLRNGVLGLILGCSDTMALASADRLLGARDALQRQAGLELLRQLFEQRRQPEACRARAESYRAARGKLSKEEQTHLKSVLESAPGVGAVSLDNALGLMDPRQRPAVVAPRARKVTVVTSNAIALLKALDDLIHQHREAPIVINRRTNATRALGTLNWEFPSCNLNRPADAQRDRLPLREVWEEWWNSRPRTLRDPDGREHWRARQFFLVHDDWDFSDNSKWARSTCPGLVEFLMLKAPLPKLKYENTVMEILDWMMLLHPVPDEIDFRLDVVESVLSHITEAALKPLVPAPGKKRRNDDDDDENDWRVFNLIEHWLDPLDNLAPRCDAAQFKRLWNLVHWVDQPIPGAKPHAPSWPIVRRACEAGLANLHELAAQLAGPRGKTSYSDDDFSVLKDLTQRRLDPQDEKFLKKHPDVANLVENCRRIIVDLELQRGDTPSVATRAVEDLSSVEGTDLLLRILESLDKTGFRQAPSYSDKPKTRAQSLTHLASVTYPSSSETPESSAAALRAALKAGTVTEERLIELAFLAPQWAHIIQLCFQWAGMSEALYWFLGHMSSWGSTAEDRAAEAAGFHDDENEDADDEDDDDESDDDSAMEKPRKLSPWERLIAERTALSEDERNDGAIDVAWFRRVHADIGAERWKRLAQGARFAANSSQARRAQLLADVLVGQANLEELIQNIRKKFLKEQVRLLGLYPLPAGANRDKELKRRFDVLAEYGRYARTLSGLTKPEALRSLEIGLQNLAATAGYADPIRLEWALGAESVQDLAQGAVSVTKDGVTVTLQLDDQVQPVVTVSRGDKSLKAPPPAVKKDKAVAALYERAREFKQQTSRQRQTLEAMMCRGDTMTAAELATLCEHPLVAPFLDRLVLVGDGIAGYPHKKGKALRDHSGKIEPIKKTELLRIAHPVDLYERGDWDKWQHECFHAERVQSFKQVFRELYLITRQEKSDRDHSQRYAGHQVNSRQAMALWGQRGWKTDEGIFKTFHSEGLVASVSFDFGITTPGEVEGPAVGEIRFSKRDSLDSLPLIKVPPRLFSEVMRDVDLVVSVAHAGGVDPEATASTVEMRTSLLRETCQLLGLKNVRFKASQALITGKLGNYAVHLGSGTVHRMPGGSVCIVPVHAQHRGRLFLPFADDDPRTAEVLSKVLLLARDHEIQDPSILDQLRS